MTRRIFVPAFGGAFRVETDDGNALSRVVFEKDVPADVFSARPSCALLEAAREQFSEYLAGTRRGFSLPLAENAGTLFRARVRAALLAIPYGETRGYGELAEALGAPRAARAVGAACGANPLLVVVPCHRVVGAGGALTGYAGGLALKRSLLEHEARFGESFRRSF